MINDIDYIKAVNMIGAFLRIRKNLNPQQIQRILYEVNKTVEKEITRYEKEKLS